MIDYKKLSKAHRILSDLNTRWVRLVMQILKEGEPMTVTQIQIALYRATKQDIGQARTSYILATMRRAGVAKSEIDGKLRWYYLRRERIAEINEAVLRLDQEERAVKHNGTVL